MAGEVIVAIIADGQFEGMIENGITHAALVIEAMNGYQTRRDSRTVRLIIVVTTGDDCQGNHDSDHRCQAFASINKHLHLSVFVRSIP